MKPLRDLFDRLHPLFAKGGRLEKLYPLYEAIDTFLYTPGETTARASHVRDGMDLKRMMVTVVLALIPCFLMAMWNTGYQANLVIHQRLDAAAESASAGEVEPAREAARDAEIERAGWRGRWLAASGLDFDPDSVLACFVYGALFFVPVFLVTNIVGLAWEILFSCVRGHDVNEGFLVTGALFPLILPPTIPLLQVAAGISFGVVIGKEVFGGTGKNFLNPALTARMFLYFAFPGQIVGDTVWTAVDGYTGATPLGALATAENGMNSITAAVGGGGIGVSWWDAFLGVIPGSMGETSVIACLLGAAVLIGTGVGSWKIMAACVLGAGGLSTLLYAVGGQSSNPMFQMSPWWHFVVGGFVFGTVFMATDPVSASMTEVGKWYYGALIGVMTILIRVINPAFPEGVMLAIIFGNVFAPTIDYLVIRRNIKRRLARNVA